MKATLLAGLVPLVSWWSGVQAMQVDLTSLDSVKSATSAIANEMLTYYKGNQTGQVPGILPGPCESDECYYWWQAGAMWGELINYWQYTGDESFQETVTQALLFQVGPDQNYNPPNQSKNMGVDDQDFWGFAAMEAAEAGMPDAGGDAPSWLSLAQAVFNFQMELWDPDSCGGGMRWQVYSFNGGYNLKNTISNGGFFQLAARLARYTGNETYAEWATKMYDWMSGSILMQNQTDGYLYIWDNTDADEGCTKAENVVWSYNYGTMLLGSAMMYNYTNGDTLWGERVQTILKGALYLFFPQKSGGNIMVEIMCEESGLCNNDQSSFKAYLARWMAVTAFLAPFTHDQIMPILSASAGAAAAQCSGGDTGQTCGRKWDTGTWDGTKGVGQQMAALSVIGATQMNADIVPKTQANGGSSKSDPNAGENTGEDPEAVFKKHPITGGDRAGAAILTILVIVSVIGLSIWIVL